ncbi:hypothetical protein ABZZ80_34760, partial [Streptomyces sp. NPDC006356]
MTGEPRGQEEPEQRPADLARRALRAAREQREGASERDAEQGGSADEESAMDAHARPGGRPGGRPGDAARAALRRAVSA